MALRAFLLLIVGAGICGSSGAASAIPANSDFDELALRLGVVLEPPDAVLEKLEEVPEGTRGASWWLLEALSHARGGACREAVAALRDAPSVDGHGEHLRALCHWRLGELREAERFFHRAMKKPDYAAEVLLAYAGMLEEDGRPDEALLQHRAFLRRRPSSTRGHYRLASLLESRGRLRDAALAYRAVLALAPLHQDARTRLASLYIELGDEDAATAALEESLRGNPSDVSTMHALVLAYRRQGKHAATHELCERALGAGHATPFFRRALAEAQLENGDEAQGLDSLRVLLAEYPTDGEVRMALGRALTKVRQFDEAAQVLSDPEFGRAFPNRSDQALGELLIAQGKVEEGIRSFGAGLPALRRSGDTARDGDAIEPHLRFVDLLANAGFSAEAVEVLSLLEGLLDEDEQCTAGLRAHELEAWKLATRLLVPCTLLERTGREQTQSLRHWDAYLESLRWSEGGPRYLDGLARARSRVKERATLLYLEGMAALRDGDADRALAFFGEVLKMEPDLSQAYEGTARALQMQGRHRDAEAALRRGLRRLGDSARGLASLLLEYLVLGRRWDEAEALLGALPAGAHPLARVRVHVANTRVQEARGLLDEMLRVRPGDARLFFELARLEERAGNTSVARSHYRRVVELDPAWGSAASALQRIGPSS